MEPASSDQRILVAALAEEARALGLEAGHGAHPELSELFDYRTDRLDLEAQNRLREHFVGCRTCARRLLDLEPFVHPETSDEAEDLEMHASLLALEDDLRRRSEGGKKPIPRWLSAAVAVFSAAVLGLALWVVELRRFQGFSMPPADSVAIDYIESVTHRTAVSSPPFELAAGRSFWVLGLLPEDPRSEPYEVILESAAGRELWRLSGLEPQDQGAVGIVLSRSLLPPGEYRLRLYGGGGAPRALLGEYVISSPAD